MNSRFHCLRGLSALLVLALGSAAPADANKAPYARGETVVVTGSVTGGLAQPLGDLEVVLEASRQGYDYLRFRKRTPVTREMTTTTASDGSFEIRWPWSKGFKRFALVVGVREAGPGEGTLHVLHREDLTRRVRQGSPIVSTVRIEDTTFLDSFREFLAGLRTEDERKVYREAGKPDKVRERVSAPETEVDWWYFDIGRVYRFKDGKLQDVDEFEPVQPLDQE